MYKKLYIRKFKKISGNNVNPLKISISEEIMNL